MIIVLWPYIFLLSLTVAGKNVEFPWKVHASKLNFTQLSPPNIKVSLLLACWYLFFWPLHYTRIQRVFTVFGPLLTEPHLHKRGTFDSWNQYVNCISNKMYCVLFLSNHQMNGCEPLISGYHSSIVAVMYSISTWDEHNCDILVFVKDSVLYCLRTRQRARSASRVPKAWGMSALAQVRFAEGKPTHVFTLVPNGKVAPK